MQPIKTQGEAETLFRFFLRMNHIQGEGVAETQHKKNHKPALISQIRFKTQEEDWEGDGLEILLQVSLKGVPSWSVIGSADDIYLEMNWKGTYRRIELLNEIMRKNYETQTPNGQQSQESPEVLES